MRNTIFPTFFYIRIVVYLNYLIFCLYACMQYNMWMCHVFKGEYVNIVCVLSFFLDKREKWTITNARSLLSFHAQLAWFAKYTKFYVTLSDFVFWYYNLQQHKIVEQIVTDICGKTLLNKYVGREFSWLWRLKITSLSAIF